MRALVTGVKGQLGHDVMNELAKRDVYKRQVLGMAEVAVVLVLGTYVFYKNQDEFILNI